MKKIYLAVIACLLIGITSKAQNLQIPVYDPLNPEMVLLESSSELYSFVNNSSKRIFFLLPGDYTDLGKITLNTDGTSSEPRWLIYYNPDKTDDFTSNPVDMEPAERAAFRQMIINGDYWRIVRLYGEGYRDQTRSEIISLRGSYNIVSNILAEYGCSGGGLIQIEGDYNIVENSVIRNTMITEGRDNHGIVFSEPTDFSQVIGCEIYNCAGDAIQVHPGDRHVGCIIKDNDIYIDPDKYFEPISTFPHENGIDFKDGGGLGSGNWIRVINNKLAWVGSKTGGTGGSEGAIDFSNDKGHKQYILFEGNIFYECPLPFTTATGSAGGSTNHITLVRNLFFNTSKTAINPVTQTQFSQEFLFNTIVNVKKSGYWMNTEVTNSDIIGNLVINGRDVRLENEEGVTSDYNVLINSSATLIEGVHSKSFEQQDSLDFEDFEFTFERFTDQLSLRIPKCRPKQATEFTYLTSDVYFGQNTGIGIDDNIYYQDWCGALTPSHSEGFTEIKILQPVDYDVVSEKIEVVLEVSDSNNDLKEVQLILDGQIPDSLEEINSNTFTWDSETVNDGLHNLKAWASDSLGHVTYSSQVIFFVDNIADSAPEITLDSPQNGEILANQFIISASVSDADDDLAGVQFMLSGDKLGNEIYVPPFEFNWYTTLVNDGEYEIKAIARDAAGRVTESEPAVITVDNSYAPLVAITTPANYSTVEGEIIINAAASDRDNDIVSVSFKINNDIVGEDFEAPYSYNWNTYDFPNDEYLVTAIAKDADGNVAPSRSRFVTVANSVQAVQINSDQILLFPNPAKEKLTILRSNHNDSFDFEIFSMLGEVMLKGNNFSEPSINLSGIPDGAYIINITMPDMQVVRKLIKNTK